MQIINWDTGQLCTPGQVGQLCVKGPQVTPKIYRNPRATKELFDADGYVKSGEAREKEMVPTPFSRLHVVRSFMP